jgi:hypothetical protein
MGPIHRRLVRATAFATGYAMGAAMRSRADLRLLELMRAMCAGVEQGNRGSE